MSIEMDNPETVLEKVGALTNLVEQMFLAHTVHNEQMFRQAHVKASQIGFALRIILDKQETE